jgi:hypothetical protein
MKLPTTQALTILALGLAALGLWHLGNRAGRAEALAEARRDSIIATFAVNDSLVRELVLARTEADSVAAQRDSAFRAIRTRYITRRDTLWRSDTVTADQALEALAVCDSTVSACSAALEATVAAVEVRDTIIATLRPELLRVRDLWREADDRARRNASPWGIGATCGYGVTTGGHGIGCVAGVSYSARIGSLWPF